MSTANIDAMVQAAIRAYRDGNKDEARQLLEKATELDPMHEQAWMWMSAVVESPEDQRTCLENVLYINPDNKTAERGLAMLPEGDSTTKEDAEEAQSDEYFVPTSSSSGVFIDTNAPSGEELDDWVVGLNLGGVDPAPTTHPEPTPIDNSFFDDDTYNSLFGSPDDDSEEIDLSDDFSNDSEQSPFFDESNEREAAVYEFGQDVFAEDDLNIDEVDEIFGSSDFGSDGPFSAAIDLNDPEPVTKSRKRRPSSPASPVEGRPTKAPGSPSKSGGLYEGDNYNIEEPDPSIYFRRIPKGIKTTRMPGVKEKVPSTIVAGVLILFLLNMGALVALIMNMGT